MATDYFKDAVEAREEKIPVLVAARDKIASDRFSPEEKDEAIRDIVVALWNTHDCEAFTPLLMEKIKHEAVYQIAYAQNGPPTEAQTRMVAAWVTQVSACQQKGMTEIPPRLVCQENPNNFLNSPFKEAAAKDILGLHWDIQMLKHGSYTGRDASAIRHNASTILSVLSPRGLTDEDRELLVTLNQQMADAHGSPTPS